MEVPFTTPETGGSVGLLWRQRIVETGTYVKREYQNDLFPKTIRSDPTPLPINLLRTLREPRGTSTRERDT